MVGKTIRQFELAMRARANESEKKAKERVIAIALDLHRRIVQKTPVDTGFCRANWNISINTLPAEKVKSGAAPPQIDVIAKVGSMKLGDTIWIYNPVVYAPSLEYGHSKQAPRGMVAVSVLEILTRYKTVRGKRWK